MTCDRSVPELDQPVRVLVLRGLDGAGGGAEHIILNTANVIDRQRFRITICCMRRMGDPLYDFDRRAAARALDYREVLHSGALDRHVLGKLRGVVDEVNPQIIHAHDYKASFYATQLARRYRIPRLATAHGWTGHTARERWLYYPVDKRQLSRFPGVIAVSNEIRESLVRYGANPDRVGVVLNAVQLESYRPDPRIRKQIRSELGLSESQIVLGAAGRIEPQKRFDVLIEAFAFLHRQRPNTRLLIAGEGSQLPQIRRQIQQRGLPDVCRLLGHCADMPRTYQAFDLLVQSSDYEGTPTVIVEAMALGIPVVATDAGGTAQLLTDREHGLLVPRRDPAAICRAVEQTLDDPTATDQRRAAARRRVETEFTFSYRTRRLERIYTQLLHWGHLSWRRLAEEESCCDGDPVAV